MLHSMDISTDFTPYTKQPQTTFLKTWLPVLIWCAIIFTFSHQQKAALAPYQPSAILHEPTLYFGLSADTILSKGAHVFLFTILGGLLFRATKAIGLTILLGLLYAGLDEWHQAFVPGRTPRLLDVGFDMSGVFLAMSIMIMLGFVQANKRVPRPASSMFEWESDVVFDE